MRRVQPPIPASAGRIGPARCSTTHLSRLAMSPRLLRLLPLLAILLAMPTVRLECADVQEGVGSRTRRRPAA